MQHQAVLHGAPAEPPCQYLRFGLALNIYQFPFSLVDMPVLFARSFQTLDAAEPQRPPVFLNS